MPQKRKYAELYAVFFDKNISVSGIIWRQIRGAAQVTNGAYFALKAALIPNVVTQSDYVHSGARYGFSHIFSYAISARRIFGIGNDFPRGGQIDYVLGHFTDEDMKTMDERVALACEMIKSFCLCGIQITMNQYNKK